MPDRQATAMLDCEDSEKERDSNCKHCQASGDNQQRYWDIQLDQDLLETIVSIYPEWFKDCNMNLAADGRDSAENSMCIPLTTSDSKESPKQENGEPVQKSIDKNKESLKVKLMLRRPLNQLVDQGILPPLKSPPAFHEQRQKLERAKMGDILKHKIQKRPDRQELIQRHILEDSCIDPSLQDKQRQLKRARLADSLNNRISQRPGHVELVQVNIFHGDDILCQAVPEGALSFKNTCDTPSPNMKGVDEDSGSDGAFSPSPPYDFSEHSQGSLPSLEASESSPNHNQGSPCSAGTSFSMSPPSSVSSPMSVLPSVVSPQSAHDQISDYIVHMQHNGTKEAPSKNRKKTKPKTQPKARTIKFHEYKGPPNAQKNADSAKSAIPESSYDLLLQQQQLFLQWQLEYVQKYPQVVLQAQKQNGDQTVQVSQKSNPTNQAQQLYDPPPSPQKLLSKLEDLKVSDLKAELKKRNLPVSGSKPLLIERLKSYSELPQNSASSSSNQSLSSSSLISSSITSSHPINVGSILLDSLHTIPTNDSASCSGNPSSMESSMDTIKELLNNMASNSRPPSTVPVDVESGVTSLEMGDISDSSSTSLSNEDLVQIQQRCIEKLQRELELSQRQLHQSIVCPPPIAPIVTSTAAKSNAHVPYSDSNTSPTTTTAAVSSPNNNDNSEGPTSAESKALQRQIIHQCLQQKIHHQQLQLKKQRLIQEAQKQAGINSASTTTPSTNANSTLTALLESRPMNASPVNLNLNTVTKAVSSFPSAVVSSQVRENRPKLEDDFPGVVPIDTNKLDTPSDLEASLSGITPLLVCQATTDSLTSKPSMSVPNGISNRSSSLPSFSDLLTCKPVPTRSNTDPQFLIGRPPPDYNEATRQLNKVKQHQLTPGNDDGNPRQSKKHKSSVKSQAVDDVLEILIKNGELPPSAAQEPTTPVTPISVKSEQIFPSTGTNDALFSKPMTTTSLLPTSMSQNSGGKEASSNSPDLHLSLQSVLDMTPPSSAGFGDAGSAPTTSLDFDFTLADIETMDLELDESHHVSSNSDPTLPIPMAKETKPPCIDFLTSGSTGGSSHLLRSNEMADNHDRIVDRGMDVDLIEWLEVLEEASTASSTSNSFQHPSSYGISNDHDTLFSNGHDALDLFSSDDMDFKPHHDLNFLPWGDKTDFTT